MKRLFFLVPDLKTTREVAQEMEDSGIGESHVHVMGQHVDQINRAHLHPTNVVQTTDLVPALRRGALLGIVLSITIYVLFSLMLPENVRIPGLGIFAIISFGVCFGIWASGMIGIGIKNQIIEKYENYVKTGHYIVVVDVPNDRENEVTNQVIQMHPNTKLAKEN